MEIPESTPPESPSKFTRNTPITRWEMLYSLVLYII